jgi:hypothetical protein
LGLDQFEKYKAFGFKYSPFPGEKSIFQFFIWAVVTKSIGVPSGQGLNFMDYEEDFVFAGIFFPAGRLLG